MIEEENKTKSFYGHVTGEYTRQEGTGTGQGRLKDRAPSSPHIPLRTLLMTPSLTCRLWTKCYLPREPLPSIPFKTVNPPPCLPHTLLYILSPQHLASSGHCHFLHLFNGSPSSIDHTCEVPLATWSIFMITSLEGWYCHLWENDRLWRKGWTSEKWSTFEMIMRKGLFGHDKLTLSVIQKYLCNSRVSAR